MSSKQLLDLPNELLGRILDELDGSARPNPFYSLVLTCHRLSHIALLCLYESITIRSYAQLESLVDHQSRAWRLPPSTRIKHLHFRVTSLDLLRVFMKPLERVVLHEAMQRVAALVAAASATCLDTLSVSIGHLDDILSAEQTDQDWTFCPAFLAIPAKTVQCTHADTLLGTVRHGFEVVVSCSTTAALLDRNTHLERLDLPFLDLRFGAAKVIAALRRAPRRIISLRLDCPMGLDNDILKTLLLGLGDTLAEKGLIIAASPSRRPPVSPSSSQQEGDEYETALYHFSLYNEGLDPSKLRIKLASEGLDVDAIMSKLDWRVGQEHV